MHIMPDMVLNTYIISIDPLETRTLSNDCFDLNVYYAQRWPFSTHHTKTNHIARNGMHIYV